MEEIKKGNTGKTVLELQSTLIFTGFLIRKDGIFGIETETAVKLFQKNSKIKSDGIVNQSTWEKLIQAKEAKSSSALEDRMYLLEKPLNKLEATTIIQKKHTGLLVEKLQIEMLKQGYLLGIDGIFGIETEKAVKDFQQKNKLQIDGVVGERTWKALLKEKIAKQTKVFLPKRSTKLPTLAQGVKGLQVEKLQDLLIENNYQLEKTGNFDSTTANVVRNFQQKVGLVNDGIVGQNTWPYLLNYKNLKLKMLKEQDLKDIAISLKIELAIIQAVFEVESNGFGFLSNTEPKILFEGHVFWQQLIERGISPAQFGKEYADILYPQWTKSYYKGGLSEYERLEKAILIHEEAALASASWGTFQIMGYHFKICGFQTVSDFVKAQRKNEGEHLKCFVNYIQWNNLIGYLQTKNWAAFAFGYNGAGYKINRYDEQLAKAYKKFSS